MNGLNDNFLDARFDRRYLDLFEPLKTSINIFSTCNVPDSVEQGLKNRRISPSACCWIAAKLGKLDKIIWHLSDNEKKDIALRKTPRQEFSERLADLPQSLKHVVLHYTRNADDFAEDPLSLALGELCRGLVMANTKASLEHGCFAPGKSEHDSNDGTQRPNLQTLTLTLSAVTPSGNWLFDRHLDAVEDEVPWVEADNLMDDKPDAPAEEDWRLYEFCGAPNVSKPLSQGFWLRRRLPVSCLR
ncbi:hypothetical protein BJ170DRAFT_678216 [Xylariales sp. AK1849]|nr:hypothetical protein BJ170DRAFT_678216 [Xylariales sp. AK1849]